MNNKKYFSVAMLSWMLIVITGTLELIGPAGVFLSWGYIAAILVAVITGNPRVITVSALLSLAFVGASILRADDADALRTVLITRSYALLGLGIVGYVVTRYMKEESRSIHEKTLMAGIFLHGTQGIILTDATGTIVMVNPFAERLFGYGPNTLSGCKHDQLIRPAAFSELSASEQLPGVSKRLSAFRRDGTEFPVEVSTNQYTSGQDLYTVHFIIDIGERIADGERLLTQKRKLEVVNQQLESFSYSVSHDLRSPLRAVGGYARMLEEDYGDKLDAEAHRLLRNIQTNATRMGSLIDDLLTFSRLGRKDVHKTVINMNQVCEVALAEISESLNHRARVEIDNLPSVMADKSLIGQVMINLLSNAIKYSSKAEVPAVRIGCTQSADYLTFCVRDNGVGFDMKYVGKLFGVFQRLHLDSEFEGTGVGLAIASGIVQKHGGKMWADAEEGKGAAFYFSLPVEEADDDSSETHTAVRYSILERTHFMGDENRSR